jgi:hypothetical protein
MRTVKNANRKEKSSMISSKICWKLAANQNLQWKHRKVIWLQNARRNYGLSIAKQFRIISPVTAVRTKKNRDASERIQKAGAEVRLHSMLNARIFCVSQRKFLIIGSGDIQTDCFGGGRFAAGVMWNNQGLIKEIDCFFEKVQEESESLI